MIKVDLSKPQLMAILNLTPDSFSDGGKWDSADKIIKGVETMTAQGADIIDVGGESTRPGCRRVSAEEQKSRILDTVAAISEYHPDTIISIDTTLAEVAEAALDSGASMLNDISAGRDDPAILELAADRQVPICLMHMQGEPTTMNVNPQYNDVVGEVCDFLVERAAAAKKYGLNDIDIILDPGIGFGKNTAHNLALLKNLNKITALGYTVLLGTSRKRFMGQICGVDEPRLRVPASCATTVLGLQAGVKMFRVHDVRQHRQVMDLMEALKHTL